MEHKLGGGSGVQETKEIIFIVRVRSDHEFVSVCSGDRSRKPKGRILDI